MTSKRVRCSEPRSPLAAESQPNERPQAACVARVSGAQAERLPGANPLVHRA